jgi:ABC-type transport system substrate-binding protein
VTRTRWSLAAATGLLVVFVSFAAAPVRSTTFNGATLRVKLLDDLRLDYAVTFDLNSWAIAYSTCANLMTYPDRGGQAGSRPYPEGAAGYPTVSRDGRRYTFRVRAGLRFHTGAPLTAANYAAALRRDLDPATQSPGADYLRDVVGIRVRGNTLAVRLSKPNPDIVFRLAMPFFCPVPVDLPHDPNAVDVIPGSGPYYVAVHEPNQQIELRRNPFYRGTRPRHAARILFTIGGDPESNFRDVENGQIDLASSAPPDAELPALVRRYDLNRSRLFTVPSLATRFLALNSARPLFHDNPSLRQAVDYALDRRALVRTLGYLHGASTDRLLPPVTLGYRAGRVYPRRADLKKARALAVGHLRKGKAVLYTRDAPDAILRAQLVKQELRRIGLDVEINVFAVDVLLEKVTRRGARFDIADLGWHADYPEPGDFVDALVDGRGIRARNNSDMAYFDNASYDRKLVATSQLGGAARYRAFGALDVEIMRNAAPYAPYANPLGVLFVAKRVGCVVRHPYFVRDYGAYCWKGKP